MSKGRYYPDPVDYTIETMQKTIDRLNEEVDFLRKILLQDSVPETYIMRRDEAEREVERATAEVERLKTEHQLAWDALVKTAQDLHDEVERLRADGKRLRDEIADEGREYRAEVERLRRDNDAYRAGNGALAQDLNETRNEVERLRADRDAFEDDMKTNLATAEKALAEVERLTAVLYGISEHHDRDGRLSAYVARAALAKEEA